MKIYKGVLYPFTKNTTFTIYCTGNHTRKTIITINTSICGHGWPPGGIWIEGPTVAPSPRQHMYLMTECLPAGHFPIHTYGSTEHMVVS